MQYEKAENQEILKGRKSGNIKRMASRQKRTDREYKKMKIRQQTFGLEEGMYSFTMKTCLKWQCKTLYTSRI